jgi:hypothetical protein
MRASPVYILLLRFLRCLDVTDTRLLEITQLSLNPPRAPTPIQENLPEEVTEVPETPADQGGPDVSASNQPVGVSVSGSFDFMQASELETPFEDNAEWVERSDAVGHQEEQAVEAVNGHVSADEPAATISPPDETVSFNSFLTAHGFLTLQVADQRGAGLGSGR